MMNKFRWTLMNTVYRAPEGGGEGGGETPPAVVPPEPESVLFPADAPPIEKKVEDIKPAGDPPADKKPVEGAADWKEYTPDPNKSDADNATAKADHDKTKPVAEDDAAKAAKLAEVPADGKYELTMPEGIELDAELAAALMPEFKEAGLTRGQAQKLVDRYIESQQKRAEGQVDTWAKTVSGWADEAKADAAIGGKNWDTTTQNARRAVEHFGSPALKEFLNASGGGNHPELIRIFAKVGATIREDDPATGGAGGAGKPADPAHVLFPSDAPKGN